MTLSSVILELLFDYDSMQKADLIRMLNGIPKKQLRWLAMHHPDNRVRKWVFRASGVQVGSGAVVNIHLRILDNFKPLVEIGERVSIAPNVTIVACSDPNNSTLSACEVLCGSIITEQRVCLEADAWIGAGAIILPGVTVGRASIVGAGSIVTKDVSPLTVVAGNPARVIRKLTAA